MTDASIPLSYKPIPLADPLEQQGKVMNLLAMRQQIQMAPLHQQAFEQQLQAGAIENQQRQQAIADDATGRKLFGDIQAGGAMPTDAEIYAKLGPIHGGAVAKSLREADKAHAELQKTRGEVAAQEQDYAGGLAAMVKAAGYSPEAVQLAIQHAHQAGYEQQAQQLLPLLQPENQGRIQPLMDALIQQSPAQQKILNEATNAAAAKSRAGSAATAAETAKTRLDAELPGLKAKSAIEAASAEALRNMTRADWQSGLDATVPDKGSPLYTRTKAAVDLALSRGDLKGAQTAIRDAGDQLGRTETAVSTARATAPIKIDVAAQSAVAKADASGLTEDDYKRAGEQYARTGVMPALGRDSITRGKIAHQAQEWARDNGLKPADLVTIQAAYAGDKESLKKFQTQRDTIVSFEQTAKKNLDLMLEKAKPLLDSGSPLLNKPLREINRAGLGSTEQAAFDAALLIANNEVAKVTSGGGLGGVLSDSARHEVEQMNPKTATLRQYIAVADVLKQDMANRHGSMDASLADIKSRIGGGGAAAPAASGGGKVERWGFDSSGKLVKQ